MSFTLSYWQNGDPFVPDTLIEAEEMNAKLNGISVNLRQITEQLNDNHLKLPESFVGSTTIPDGAYADSLLHINQDGDVDLMRVSELSSRQLEDIVDKLHDTNALSVTGTDHRTFFILNYEVPANPTVDEGKVIVNVGRTARALDGDIVTGANSVIFFMVDTDAEVWFQGDSIYNVQVLSPSAARANGRNSVVALKSIGNDRWVLVGDLYPAEELSA
ncbi:hypothetical protein [Paraferrimonas sedimenticola]|uniref:Uncharacterized protein n=1 Tax=Paraferrimonas sedimenticola TaxID=375674 RepID=A0AA37RVF1_9GAMM|nr:hypothetical protein [Paraferrimonas sedimenticola]GLP95287.1 hypothetical protein GCM10007895_05930 [Paraferrimonas sedimenticola]